MLCIFVQTDHVYPLEGYQTHPRYILYIAPISSLGSTAGLPQSSFSSSSSEITHLMSSDTEASTHIMSDNTAASTPTMATEDDLPSSSPPTKQEEDDTETSRPASPIPTPKSKASTKKTPSPKKRKLTATTSTTNTTTSPSKHSNWSEAEDAFILRLKNVERQSDKAIAAALAIEMGVQRTPKSVNHRLYSLKKNRFDWTPEIEAELVKVVERVGKVGVLGLVAEIAAKEGGVLGGVGKGAVVVKLKALVKEGRCAIAGLSV
ncbi:hypothetical protein EDC01DRAFT_786887 [Geopyxis carbonaria]|nr:hypothetical protein EDC01DRAFT_786887 [Geopyxis carbonaria]